MSLVAERLEALGIVLPRSAAPVANYVAAAISGSWLIVSGQLPIGFNGNVAITHTGELPSASTIDYSREAARLCGISLVARVLAALGDLDRVVSVVRLGGFFNVEGRFDALPAVMNSASDVMIEIFAERGRHVGATAGVANLPLDALCEVEPIFEVAA